MSKIFFPPVEMEQKLCNWLLDMSKNLKKKNLLSLTKVILDDDIS